MIDIRFLLAGWKTEQILGTMPGMLDLAAAAGADLAQTTDIVSDNMTAMDVAVKDASHFMDVYAYALTNSNARLSDFGETMKYAAPVAKAYGSSLDETAAMIMMMANAGIKGSMAGTSLRMGLLRLAGPPKTATKAMAELGLGLSDAQAGALEAQAVIEGLGIDLSGASTPAEKMTRVLMQLHEKTKNLSQDEKLAVFKGIFGVNAETGWLALFEQGPEAFLKYVEGLRNADGYAKQVAATMMDDTEGALKYLESAWDGAQESFGKALSPAVRSAAEAITPLLSSFAVWAQQNPAIIQGIVGITAAIFGLITAIAAVAVAFTGWEFITAQLALFRTGMLTTEVAGLGLAARLGSAFGILQTRIMALGFSASLTAGISGAFTAIGTAIRSATVAALGFIATPLGAALTAAAIAAYVVYQNWERISPAISQVGNAISSALDGLMSALAPIGDAISNLFSGIFEGLHFEGAMDAIVAAFLGLVNVVAGVAVSIINIFTATANTVSELFTGLSDVMSQALEGNFGMAEMRAKKMLSDVKAEWANFDFAKGDFGYDITGSFRRQYADYYNKGQNSAWRGTGEETPSQAAVARHAVTTTAQPESQPATQAASQPAEQPQLDVTQAQTQINTLGQSTEQPAQSMTQVGQGAQQASQAFQEVPQNIQPAMTALQNIPAMIEPIQAAILTAAAQVSQLTAALTFGADQVGQLTSAATFAADQVGFLTSVATIAAAQLAFLGDTSGTAAGQIFFLGGTASGATGGILALGSAASMAATMIASAALSIAVAAAGAASAASRASAAAASIGKPAANYQGGIYNKGAFLTWFAEKSPEAAIPLDKSERAINLWTQAGQMLGVLPAETSVNVPNKKPARGSTKTEIINLQRLKARRANEIFNTIKNQQTLTNINSTIGGTAISTANNSAIESSRVNNALSTTAATVERISNTQNAVQMLQASQFDELGNIAGLNGAVGNVITKYDDDKIKQVKQQLQMKELIERNQSTQKKSLISRIAEGFREKINSVTNYFTGEKSSAVESVNSSSVIEKARYVPQILTERQRYRSEDVTKERTLERIANSRSYQSIVNAQRNARNVNRTSTSILNAGEMKTSLPTDALKYNSAGIDFGKIPFVGKILSSANNFVRNIFGSQPVDVFNNSTAESSNVDATNLYTQTQARNISTSISNGGGILSGLNLGGILDKVNIGGINLGGIFGGGSQTIMRAAQSQAPVNSLTERISNVSESERLSSVTPAMGSTTNDYSAASFQPNFTINVTVQTDGEASNSQSIGEKIATSARESFEKMYEEFMRDKMRRGFA